MHRPEAHAELPPRAREDAASEIRAFGPDGAHVATLTRQGQGPGELAQANGLAFSPDGVLWANDHGNWVMIGFSPAGEEVDRRPMMVPGYGYTWEAVIDDSGRVWQTWGHSEPRERGT